MPVKWRDRQGRPSSIPGAVELHFLSPEPARTVFVEPGLTPGGHPIVPTMVTDPNRADVAIFARVPDEVVAAPMVVVLSRSAAPLPAGSVARHHERLVMAEHPMGIAARRRHLAVRSHDLGAWRRLLRAHPIVVHRRRDDPPHLVSAAQARLSDPISAWAFDFSLGDVRSRNLLWLATADGGRFTHVLKFGRVADMRSGFEAESEAGELIGRLPSSVRDRVPHHFGVVATDPVVATLEEAIPGESLLSRLRRRGSTPPKLELIDGVVDWAIALARATTGPPEAGAHRVLEQRLLANYPDHRAIVADSVRRTGGLATVMTHNDLGSWNMRVRGRQVHVLDWESWRRGLPLWDISYFVTCALGRIFRPRGPAETTRAWHHRLQRGDLEVSSHYFAAIDRAVEALGLPSGVVPHVLRLCWLSHALSPRQRAMRAGAIVDDAPFRFYASLAQPWLDDPELWSRWPS